MKLPADQESRGITIKSKIELEKALEQLAAHKITLGRAAELAGISIWEMLDIVKEKRIDWLGFTPEDIEKDLEIAKKISKELEKEKNK